MGSGAVSAEHPARELRTHERTHGRQPCRQRLLLYVRERLLAAGGFSRLTRLTSWSSRPVKPPVRSAGYRGAMCAVVYELCREGKAGDACPRSGPASLLVATVLAVSACGGSSQVDPAIARSS